MRNTRIYTDQPLKAGEIVTLDQNASHHLLKVLKCKIGANVTLFNGQGGEYYGLLSNESSKKNALIDINNFNPVNRESQLRVDIAIGISRNDRLDWVLQKSTELGVTQLHLITTKYSHSHQNKYKLSQERIQKRMEHWQKIVVSACEQSQRNNIPQVNFYPTLADFLKVCNTEANFVLHHRHNKGLDRTLSPKSITLLVGPEGGLNDEEITLATEQGFMALCLGPRILRTETAPLAALSIMQYQYGDF